MPGTRTMPGKDEMTRRVNEDMFRVLVECSPNMIARFDRDLRYLYVNRQFERVFGVVGEQVMSKTVREAGADERYASAVEEQLRRVLATGREEAAEVRVGDRYYHTRFVPQRGPGGVESVVSYSDDITERRRGREQLDASYRKLQHMIGGIIHAVSRLVEMRDPYTAGHQRHVSQLAHAVALEMGLPPERAEGIRIAGLIHDLGKLSVPVEILNKMGRLTPMEFAVISIHPAAGYEMLKDIDFPWPIAEVAHQHQERFDGSGYPRGLKGDRILPEARIVTVADVVEAMTFNRPYRPLLGLDRALEQIDRGGGLLYDPAPVGVCLKLFREGRFHFDG